MYTFWQLWPVCSHPNPSIQTLKFKLKGRKEKSINSLKSKVRNLNPGICILELACPLQAGNLELGIWNLEFGTWNFKSRIYPVLSTKPGFG